MFQKTVIYIYEHNTRTGAQGLVINRPSQKTRINQLIEDPMLAESIVLDEPIFHGGPVAERTITMLHTSEWFSSNTKLAAEDFSVSSDRFMIEKIATGNVPHQWFMAAGKCGWVPGQLETEMAKGCWLPLTAKPSIVFSSGTESLWKLCIELCASEMVDTYF
jgi:putative transcriptional regulator